jgi:hypothetical protein
MRLVVLLAACALAAACSRQPQTAEKQQPAAAPAAAEAPPMEQDAIAAVSRMATYLRTLQDFEIRANTTIDEVAADNGQKLQFGGTTLYRVHRPNSFLVQTRTDRRHRDFYYNGSEFTVYSPRMKFYATAPAPATIIETVNLLEERYDIQLPLTNLFTWGTEQGPDLTNITSADHIGYARINGADTDQYAFRQGAYDWQIWIERGERPLPRKFVITTREEEGQPQYVAELSWNLHPHFTASTFTYRPAADARRIQFAANAANGE